jgi:hypothetical protein
VVADGSGGAFVAASENRGSGMRVYVQHVDAHMEIVWPADGVRVSLEEVPQRYPSMADDGAGGVFVAWLASTVRLQHVLGDGQLAWATEVAPSATGTRAPILVADGVGGVFVAWGDVANFAISGIDLYVMRYTASGSPHPDWSSGALVVSEADGNQGDSQQIQGVEDGSGGAILAWGDGRDVAVNGSDIYAQRMGPGPVTHWAEDGVPVVATPGEQYGFQMALAPDGTGGVFVAWTDHRSASGSDGYAQHMTASGNADWMENGVVVASEEEPEFILPGDLVADGLDGVFVASYGDSGGHLSRLAAADGSPTNGWPVSFVGRVPLLVGDDDGGAIVVWNTGSPGSYRVRGNRYSNDASLVGVEPAASAVRLRSTGPNPTPAEVIFEIELPFPDQVSVDVYDIAGRRVRRLSSGIALAAGPHRVRWDGRDGSGAPAASGVYILRVTGSFGTRSTKVSLAR